jgi:hypothetical protein
MAHEMSMFICSILRETSVKAQWAGLLGALGDFRRRTAGSLARLGIQLGAGSLMMILPGR